MFSKFDKIALSSRSLRLGVQIFFFQVVALLLATVSKKASAETSPVEPDAVNTAVGKSLQLPYTYIPVNSRSVPTLCSNLCNK